MQQLGCSKGVSVQEIMDRMPENSYLQQVQGNYDPIVDTPVPFGVLSIKKTTNYFVEVQFTQMTYKSKRPQLYIGNVVENKIVGWERFVSEAELRAQIEKLQEQINLLIDNDNETK